jgi:AcrR family transcriptional regulator
VPSLSRAESQAATREALVTAAEGLLREKSYAELTVRAVAARAGFTTGAFFAHFPSKADLVLELITRSRSASMEFILDVVDVAWAAHDDDYAAERLLAHTREIHAEAVVMLDVLAQGMRDPDLAPRVGALMFETTTAFSSMSVHSDVPDEHRRAVASQVLALWQGLLLQSIGQPELDIAVLFARGARTLIQEHAR